eukprot:TRINITY_DN37689_c0_g1_i1.p1 TRINITY_DN37689_c0_g1~~TRINITY_DN37689_c0_g1_i1.p1  ORF type:complete len:257 (-),score=45.86 TRINITY_DN37689_c0_g1_i1:55-825(-)
MGEGGGGRNFTTSLVAFYGLHAAPTVTHSLVRGQHTCPLAQGWAVSQRVPGFTGVRQCFASGQQYEVEGQIGVHAGPTDTHSFVSGQHTCPERHEFESAAQLTLVGVRQCFASGQQYEVALHPALGASHAALTVTHSLVRGQHTCPLAQGWAVSQRVPGIMGCRQCFVSGQQYSSLLHTGCGVHGMPGFTQSFVSGQHTWPVRQVLGFAEQLTFVGLRHAIASGQQYSSTLHPIATAARSRTPANLYIIFFKAFFK